MRLPSSALALWAVVAYRHHCHHPLGVDAAAMACADDIPCTMNFTAACEDVVSDYRLYGSCCSLQDMTMDDGTAGCQLTVAGNGTDCNWREPDYSCDPSVGCLPEYNVMSAFTDSMDCPASSYEVPTERPESPDVDVNSGSGSGSDHCPYVRPATIQCILETDESVACEDIQAPTSCGNGVPVFDRVKFSYDLQITEPPGAALVESVRYREPMTSSSNPYERKVPITNTPGTVLIPSGTNEGDMHRFTVMDWELDPIDLCDPGPYNTTWNFETTAGDNGGPNCKTSYTYTFSIPQAPTPPTPAPDVCNLEMEVECFVDSAYTQKCEDYDGDCDGTITAYYRYRLRNPAPMNSDVVLTFSEAVRIRDGRSLNYLTAMEPFDYKIVAAPGMNTFTFPETVNNYDVCGWGAAAPPATTFRATYTSSADPSRTCTGEEMYDPSVAGLEGGPVPMSADADEEKSGAGRVSVLAVMATCAVAAASLSLGLF